MWKNSFHLQIRNLSAASANVSWTVPKRVHVGTFSARCVLSSGLTSTTVARHVGHGCQHRICRTSFPWCRTWLTNWWCSAITATMAASRNWCSRCMMPTFRNVNLNCCRVQMLAAMRVFCARISRSMSATRVNLGKLCARKDVVLRYQSMI